MTTELREAIARLRSRAHRGLQEHDDTVLVCDALEAHLLNWTAEERATLKRGGSVDVVVNGTVFKARSAPKFDMRRAMEAAKEAIEDNDEAGAYSIIKNALAQCETAPKFDKVAYQREYMRKWRKVQKLFKID
jgi:hypothetical protein